MKNCHKAKSASILLLMIFVCLRVSAQENPQRAEADRLISEASLSIKEKRFDEAVEKTTKVLELFPKSGDVYVMRGIAYQQTGETEKAIEDLSKAMTLGTNATLEVTAHRMRGMIFYQLKKFPEAIKDFDFVISIDSSNYRDYGFRGWCYLDQNDYQSAVVDFDSLLKMNPDQIGFRFSRAKANFYLKNYAKVIEDTTEEITNNPSAVIDNYLLRANSYRQLGKNDLAETDEKRYIDLGGKLIDLTASAPSSSNSGKGSYDTEKIKAIQTSIYQSITERNYVSAFKEVEALIKNVPDKENINIKSLIYVSRGANFFKQGDFQKALDDLNEAIRLNEKSYLAYQGRAATYRKLGMNKEADADQAKFEQLQPKEK